jgi:hypothetical protein
VEAVPDDIVRYEEVWAEAVPACDQATLEALLAPEFALTSASTGVVPRGCARRSARTSPSGSSPSASTPTSTGHVAVVNARQRQRARRDGQPLECAFLLTDVWISREARCQVVARHSSPLA